MSALEDAVSKDEDGTWRFTCGAPAGLCGEASPDGWQAWTTRGWPTKASAVERGREHAEEHATGIAGMTPMHSGVDDDGNAFVGFLEKHGLTTDANGKAVVK